MKKTDKELLDFLQGENDKARFTGKCIFRISTLGRGWRLHETEVSSRMAKAKHSVREAITDAMNLKEAK